MAIRITFADYKHHHLTCPSCGWNGLGKEASQNTGGMVMDLECPACFKMLAIINFTTYQETFGRGNEEERQAVLREINFREKFRRLSLKGPDELPNLQGNNLTFTFQSRTIKGEDFNVIEHQVLEIWREPIVWEGYERFMEIGRILKEKYWCKYDRPGS